MKYLKKLWLIADGLVMLIFSLFGWSVSLFVLFAILLVVTLILMPVYHWYVFINRWKEVK